MCETLFLGPGKIAKNKADKSLARKSDHLSSLLTLLSQKYLFESALTKAFSFSFPSHEADLIKVHRRADV